MDKKTKHIKEVRVMIRLTPAVHDEVDELMAAKLTQPKAIEKILEDYCRLKTLLREFYAGQVLTDQDVYEFFHGK